MVLEIPDATASKPKSRADDLFAAHDPTKTRKKAAKGKKRRRGATDVEEAKDNDEGGNPASANGTRNNASATQPPLLQELQDLNIAAAREAENADPVAKGLQIMDFESDEPMIMYQGQMYSCKWATSLGSDLLFMRRPENPGPDYNPLRSFKEVDLLSIATAKLIASPAIVERKPFTMQADAEEGEISARMTLENEDVIRQARFLGRIADIKTQRGEPVGNLKSLANTVLENPEAFAPDGRKKRGGRVRATIAASPKRRPSTTARTRDSPPVDGPTVASTRSRRASTQSATAGASPALVVQLDDDEEMIDV